MRAANRKVNICTSGTGRIGCSTLQCTTTVSFRFVTRLNSVCEALRATAGVDLAPGERGPVIPDRQLSEREIKALEAPTGKSNAEAALKAWAARANAERTVAEFRAALKSSLKDEAAGRGKHFR